MADVTDATFQTQVLDRSATVPVVVDLWAEWCGPCKQLGPIIERVIANTAGQVELAKVDVDANPQVSQMFQVQGIPAVYALKDGKVVDGFTGAKGEAEVTEFVAKLLPTDQESEIDALIEQGTPESLQAALEIQPDHPGAVVAMAKVLIEHEETDTALALLNRIPESPETRHVAALARAGGQLDDDVEAKLEELLTKAKAQPEARQEFLDTLELMGPDDPRTSEYRKRLAATLF